ncbi:MAG: hypothetical protein JWN80_587 [Microbacteriaceae bacterium]|nr:hypothetical protein [Microbacteriaceae bacterium]
MKPVLAVLAVFSIAALLLTGCAATPAVPLSVSFFQYRSDLAVRHSQIEVHNRSKVAITVTSATFSSAWFTKTVSSASAPSQVPAGSTIDFPVALPKGVCSSTTPKPVVTVHYTTADGTKGATTLTPTLPYHTISSLHAEDCSLAEFQKVATITAAGALRFEPVGDKQNALIDFTITPTGAPGSVEILSTQNTTLLSQTEGELRTIDETFTAASSPTVLTLDVVPSRCEAHVIAEDKVGTVIPFRVNAGPYKDAVFTIAVPQSMKNQLLDYVGDYCQLTR